VGHLGPLGGIRLDDPEETVILERTAKDCSGRLGVGFGELPDRVVGHGVAPVESKARR
jgi:hypothetical protein